jgi:hypothetical protein
LDYLKRQQQKEAAGDIGTPSPNPRARERSATPEPQGTFALQPLRAPARGTTASTAPKRARRGRQSSASS